MLKIKTTYFMFYKKYIYKTMQECIYNLINYFFTHKDRMIVS